MKGVTNNTKIIGEKKSVADYKAYAFYRDNSKLRKKTTTPNFVEYGKIINSIYEKVSENLVNNEGGVFADSFFYAVPTYYPQKKVQKVYTSKGLRSSINAHTKGLIYTILFVNLLPEKKYWMWSMDYTFYRTVKKNLANNLKNFRPKYKFFLNTILNNLRLK